MKTRKFSLFIIVIAMVCGCAGCDFFKKKVPPAELFKNAEEFRKNENWVEAANLYDTLVKQNDTSELTPLSLYYSGICKYTLGGRTLGKNEFDQRKDSLAEAKKAQYQQWLDYLKKQSDDFVYIEAVDKYVYQGNEFKTLIENYPSSDLIDDAAFQIVRLNLAAKQSTNALTLELALQLYADYFEQYPQSPYRQKGIEHLLQLVAEQSNVLANHTAITEAYQRLARAGENLSDVAQLSYALGITFLEANDPKNAAVVLGVPSVLGVGVVDTDRTKLNIRSRSGQGTDSRIIAKLEKGETIILLSKTGVWYNVKLKDGAVGFAREDYIKTAN